MDGLPSKYDTIDAIELNKSLDNLSQEDEHFKQRTTYSESVLGPTQWFAELYAHAHALAYAYAYTYTYAHAQSHGHAHAYNIIY